MTPHEIQNWFGKTVAYPLQPDQMLPNPLKEQASHFITPSQHLNPGERIEIYHRQYWWRLLKSLQTHFPLVVRLFGSGMFQQKLAVPYLSSRPPSHWALCRLGESFPEWIDSHYHEEDALLIKTAAEIDWAVQKAFWIGNLSPIEFEKFSPEETLTKPITLQLHIQLFSLPGDFFSFREAFLEHEPDYYSNHPFPQLALGDNYFVLYRSQALQVCWKKISLAEYHLLSLFKEKNTIEKACTALESLGGSVYEEALSHIPFWFKQWTVLKWFGQSSSLSL